MMRSFLGQKLVLIVLAIVTTLAFSNVVVPAIGGPSATQAKKKKVRRGPPGPQGPQGPAGPPGASATSLWALVAPSGALLRASGAPNTVAVTHGAGSGIYQVLFNQVVSNCAYAATLASTIGMTDAVDSAPNAVTVATRDGSGALSDRAFNLIVVC